MRCCLNACGSLADEVVPVLPLCPGIPEKRNHDYIRHGTTTLFAALVAISLTCGGTAIAD